MMAVVVGMGGWSVVGGMVCDVDNERMCGDRDDNWLWCGDGIHCGGDRCDGS